MTGRLLLLTGRPGVGKTTVLRALAVAPLPGVRRGGFYTEEIRADGERRGFRLVTLDGTERVMAHVDLPPPRVGRYGVNVRAIDAVAASALDPRGADLYLVDEIGKMECLSARFVAAVRALLDSGRPVVATVAQRGTGLIAEVKRRPGAELWEVTRANRDALPERALDWIRRGR